jgi:S-formylglutathione hydrolase
MGGHGAIVSYLRNPSNYISVSAIAPIVNPSTSPFGLKNFNNYFDSSDNQALNYDSLVLLDKMNDSERLSLNMLVDFATHDEFNATQLEPFKLETLVKSKNFPNLKIDWNKGYDHSYFFVSSVA